MVSVTPTIRTRCHATHAAVWDGNYRLQRSETPDSMTGTERDDTMTTAIIGFIIGATWMWTIIELSEYRYRRAYKMKLDRLRNDDS